MPKRIEWDAMGEKTYETGVNQGVLYPLSSAGKYDKAVPWNGLTAVTESPSGAEATKLYADNIQYLTMYSAEEFGATIEAYMYPDEFKACDGTAELLPGVNIGQQARKVFGLAYTTIVGNDVAGEAFGKKIHLIYGCMASPSEKNYQTKNDSPEAITFSWEMTSTPVNVTGFKPTSSLILDSTVLSEKAITAVENALYGTSEKDGYLPLPDEIKTIIEEAEAAG